MAIATPQARHIAAPTCDLHIIARALGLELLGTRAVIARVNALIAQRGFPKPFPSMRNRRPGETQGAMTQDVTTRSRWRQHAVDLWLDNYLPPETHAAINTANMAAAATDMDQAAKALRLIKGGRA